MPVPSQPSWPKNGGGHALMQFSVSEFGPGSDQWLPTNNDSEPELYNAGLQMRSMPQLPPQDPHNLDAPAIGAMHNQPGPSQFHAPMFTDTSMCLQLHHHNPNTPAFGTMHQLHRLPQQDPWNLDTPTIGAMHIGLGHLSFMLPSSLTLNLDAPAFGAMYNDVMNLSIAQSPYLATGPLYYYPSPNMGSFYPDFSEPVMSKGKAVALPPGTEHEPHQEVMFVDEDTMSGQHGEQHQQGGKVQSTFKFCKYHWPPRKRGKVAMGRVEKSSSAPSTALPITASAPSTPTYRMDLVYDKKNTTHQRIVNSAEQAIIKDAVNENCLKDPSTRQQLVLQELRAAAASEYEDEVFQNNWAAINLETLYTDLSVPYESIMQTSKKIARNIVQLGYRLQPPAWAAVTNNASSQLELG
ncbi:hypothetical protein F4604DRAFT_1915991 [Suillus subluteus]|nr:hypothetical protein F4604DRAFT_1915991 [Suillus subluteus]